MLKIIRMWVVTGLEGLEVLGRWWRFGERVDIHDAKAAHEIVPCGRGPVWESSTCGIDSLLQLILKEEYKT
jgi:hypothetical protein